MQEIQKRKRGLKRITPMALGLRHRASLKAVGRLLQPYLRSHGGARLAERLGNLPRPTLKKDC
jgi:hypothetical protein